MENEKRKYWFFGSKLNTGLLLILILLMAVALRWMYKNKKTYLPILGQESPVTQTDNQNAARSITYTYSNHGFSIELPIGSTPKKFDETDGGDISYFLFRGVYLDYSRRASWWEKNKLIKYTYMRDQKIGETTFKVYLWDNGTHYWFRNEESGYDFLATDNNESKLEELLKTFKFFNGNN